ncbi:MAG: hypothetical protein ACLFP1_08880 [Candidatus Goldiibacteriota bacterium]
MFSGIVHAVIYYILSGKKDVRSLVKPAVVFLIPFFIFPFMNIAYNHARFSTPFSNGIKKHQMEEHFRENFEKHGYMSVFFIPNNFVREVVMPPPVKKRVPVF